MKRSAVTRWGRQTAACVPQPQAEQSTQPIQKQDPSFCLLVCFLAFSFRIFKKPTLDEINAQILNSWRKLLQHGNIPLSFSHNYFPFSRNILGVDQLQASVTTSAAWLIDLAACSPAALCAARRCSLWMFMFSATLSRTLPPSQLQLWLRLPP